jgi:hypothetical protein
MKKIVYGAIIIIFFVIIYLVLDDVFIKVKKNVLVNEVVSSFYTDSEFQENSFRKSISVVQKVWIENNSVLNDDTPIDDLYELEYIKMIKQEIIYKLLKTLDRLQKRYQLVTDLRNLELQEAPLITKEGHLSLLGRVIIESNNVNMPIVEGTSDSDIAISAGHLENTAYPGHIGNAVFAGHRGYNYGLLFNRLDELNCNDLSR